MKKIVLAVITLLCSAILGSAQDFSFDELVQLRKDKYPAFQTYVHDKGYARSSDGKNEMSAVFRSGKNVITYSHHNDGDGIMYHRHNSISYETPDKGDYQKLKKQIEANTKHYSSMLHKHRRMNYIEHIYANDAIVARLYSIAYRNDDKPYFRIEISSVYEGMEQER